jgi:GNAT superfamily N-acetyltransferase
MEVRSADESEVDRLGTIWFEAWQDAHARILPPQLVRARTLGSFRDRIRAALSDVRVVEASGESVGLCIVKSDELYQLFVSARARGTGAAAALLADAETRIRGNGAQTAWLACAIGNDRAARFYEKNGWRRIGNMVSRLETPNGEFPLKVWRYEKRLAAAPPA